MFAENSKKHCEVDNFWKKGLAGSLFLCGLVGYSLHACMNAFDPGFQVKESYTWIYDIFEGLTMLISLLIVLILVVFAVRVWIVWPTLLIRHKVGF